MPRRTPAFLMESIRCAKVITQKGLLARLDAGNDSLDNIEVNHGKIVGSFLCGFLPVISKTSSLKIMLDFIQK